MKTGRMIGLVVVAGVAIGAALSAIMSGFNFGGGTGSGDGKAPVTQKRDAKTAETDFPLTKATTDETPADTTESKPATDEAPPPAIIYVRIEGWKYQLRRGDDEKAAFEAADLDGIVEAAQAATGDDNGIRVRIEQKSSSRETAEQDLKKKLDEAGIPRDSIRWKDEPVDSK